MAKKMTIDFGGVPKEIRKGGGKKLPEADYVWKIISSEIAKKEGATSRYIRWQLTVAKGPFKGVSRSYITSLKPEALFNLRNLIHAATGKNVAGKSLDFDRENLYGKLVGGTIVDSERPIEGGKTRIFNDLDTVFPVSDMADDEDEDEEDTDDEEVEEDDDDLEDVDVDEL